MGTACSAHEKLRNAYKVLAKKSKEINEITYEDLGECERGLLDIQDGRTPA
jgi:hypothetical protein